MPSTYTLISSNVLASSAASVTFSAISSTYTDLVLRWSARTSTAGEQATLYVRFNSDSATNYSRTTIVGTGSAALSLASSSNTEALGIGNGSGSTASTFSNAEMYLPNYLVAQNKAFSVFQVYENNATSNRIFGDAELYRSTAAITTISLTAPSSTFDVGSSFYLYGIKNS